MKNSILIFVLFIIVSSAASAQWIPQATGFPTGIGTLQIVIVDPLTVWVPSYDTLFYGQTNAREITRTTDGGATWTPGSLNDIPPGHSWACLSAINGQTAWGAFYDDVNFIGGGVWRTNDGGNSWAQQTVYGGSSFPDVVHFWNANTGVTIGDPVDNEFEIYTTSDGGTTWTLVDGANIPDPLPNEYGTVRASDVWNNTIWFGTTLGRVFKSKDFGATWAVSSTGDQEDAIQVIEFANEKLGWMEVSSYALSAWTKTLRTEDGGATWTNITTTGHYFWGGLAYVPGTNSTLVTSGYDYAYTTNRFGSAYSLNGGDSWTTIDSTGFHINEVAFYNSTTGWSGGLSATPTDGGIFKWNGTIANGSSCPAPVNFSISSITSSSAKLKWNESLRSKEYKVRYRITGTTEWTKITISHSTKKLNGLLPSTEYDWQVKSLCGIHPSDVSGWSDTQNFTTSALKVGLMEEATVEVYPNPVSQSATVSFSLPTAAAVTIAVENINGQLIKLISDQEFSEGNHEIIFDCSSLNPGLYLLQLKTPMGITTHKMVVVH